MVADLTGLEIANASLLDEATAAAEAMAMAQRIRADTRSQFFADRDCHPQTIAVMQTRAEALGWQLSVGDPFRDLDARQVFGAILQYPGTYGEIHDFRELIAKLNSAGRRDGCGFARSRATQTARRAWRRYRSWIGAAVRRADGFWRTSCSLHCDQVRA
jgi:glycine cleavage system protein